MLPLGHLRQPMSPQLTLQEDSYTQTWRHLSSPSYPGILTVYEMHRVRGRLPGLPSQAFCTEEVANGGKMVTWWEWTA